METKPQVLVALDTADADEARYTVEELSEADLPFGLKVGMELACAAGHRLIRELIDYYDTYIFDDQKRIDISNTIKKTMPIQLAYGAQMANCMCGCGPKGIRAFADACTDLGHRTSIGVTVLTTKDDDECQEEFGRTALEQVKFYAQWGQDNGLDGVVCSPLEIEAIKTNFKLLTVTPGIRPNWARANDQKRITTPREAVRRGADWLVIGRPITDPQYGPPADNLKRVLDEIC